MSRRLLHPVLALATLTLVACAGQGGFTLSSDDNNPASLHQAFATEAKPAPDKPVNGSGKAMAFLVTAAPKKLVAWSLAADKQVWSVAADITSRVVVGSNLVAARE